MLEYTPAGGTFSGRGITEFPWTFNPAIADTTDSPHEIIYLATNEFGCASADTVDVHVLAGTGFITVEKETACSNDPTLLIAGYNITGTPGSFTIEPALPAGAFTDFGNDTAVLKPELISFPRKYSFDNHVYIYRSDWIRN